MNNIQDILNFFERFAPNSLAESWDNVGLLVGRKTAKANTIMTCLTLTPNVAREAIDKQANLIISHHPIMFRPIQSITDENSEGNMLLELIENNIAVFSPHTRYDSASNGINQQLAESIGLEQIKPIRSLVVEEDSIEDSGSGRMGRLSKRQSFADFCDHVKQTLNVPQLITTSPQERMIQTVGIACGSAAEFLSDATKLGCDAFITGEGRFHTAFEAQALNVGLILMGHYQTERPAMQNLVERLGEEFAELNIWASESESDPFEIR